MKTLNATRSFFVTKASKFLSFLISVILLLGMFSAALPSSAADTSGEKAVFGDISKHWAKNDILWAYENAIAAGTAEKTFSPDAEMEANGIPKTPENYRMVFRDSFIPWANNFLKKQNVPGVYWEHCLLFDSTACPPDLRSGYTEEMMQPTGWELRNWWRAQEGMDS